LNRRRRQVVEQFAILRVLGILLLPLALLMTIPGILLYFEQEAQYAPFFLGAGVTLLSGIALSLPGWRQPIELTTRQIFVLTTSSWLAFSAFASLPFMFGSLSLSWTDAWFETVSGITTTGSTVITGLDRQSDGILLWRGMLQWLGGIGIIVLGMSILPYLHVGGMRLFHTESSDWSEKALPRSRKVTQAIGYVYLGLTVSCAGLYFLFGMEPLDAIVHAMTTLATGGFANYDASFGYYYAGTPEILWVSSLFMMLGSMPFLLYVRMLYGDLRSFLTDSQPRAFIAMVLFFTAILTLYLAYSLDRPPFEALTQALFNATSIITTTGYAADDYHGWGVLAVILFFYMTFVGGCSGSTAGGFKIFRLQIAATFMVNQLRSLVHRKGVFVQKYNDRVVSREVIASMIAFSMFFFATIAVLAALLSALGLDFMTSLTGAMTAVCNVGPGLGHIIGPAGNFEPLPDAAKWLLSVGMLMGRLEIMTVVVLFAPMFWRE
jgi:trk system potassium uptake protein TrkH